MDLESLAGFAEKISQPRLIALINRLAQFGALESGGVDRQALSEQDSLARKFLIEHAQTLGCEVLRDEAGNIFFRREGLEKLPPVVTGSHIDTQPTGGKLDGAYGVCAGLEFFAALQESGVSTRHPVEVVIWNNEEGCRFAPGSMGSAAYVEPERLSGFLNSKDRNGIYFRDELAKDAQLLQTLPVRQLRTPFAAFVEAHIEQGPVLEQKGFCLGQVTGIQGVRWFKVTVVGRSSHAGTTPAIYRKDALRTAANLVHEAYEYGASCDEDLRFTVGRFDVSPNATNTITNQVVFTIDLRHPDDNVLDRFEHYFQDWVVREGDCVVSVERIMHSAPTIFPQHLRDAVGKSAELCEIKYTPILSGAFHDSMFLARHCPTTMIFVPSIDGLSHHPDERTDPEHLTVGARTLALTLLQLACPTPNT